MNIITITLNPAIDVHVSSDSFRQSTDGLYAAFKRDSGGKGVNVSRALRAFSTDSLCCIAVGKDNAEEYLAPLREGGMNLDVELVPGSVRENIHVNMPEGDLVVPTEGACVDNTALLGIKERVLSHICDGSFVCLCGKLPPECDKGYVMDMLRTFKARGAKIILDSRSFDLDDIRSVYPYMIKPNYEELKGLISSGNIGKCDIPVALGSLCGVISENIFVTLGADGAIFASSDGLYEIVTPRMDAVSTTGAGDSVIAGYMVAELCGAELQKKLSLACAFGCASCLREGTLPPLKCDITEILESIEVKKIAVK